MFFTAESADNAHAGQILTRHPGHAVKPRLNLFEKRDADEHNGKDDRKQHRYRNDEYPRALYVDRKGHGHRAEHDKRTSQQQPQPHVHAVLHLIYIVGKACYHGIRAELVELCERQALYMVKHGLPQLCCKADACPRREILRGYAAQ